MSIQLASVKSYISELLTDEDMDFWTPSFISAAITEAQCRISELADVGDLDTKRVTIDAVDGVYQSIPDDGARLVRIESNGNSGKSINKMEMDELNLIDNCWRAEDAAGYADIYVPDDEDKTKFYVYPQLAAGDPITLTYVVMPEPFEEGQETINLAGCLQVHVVNWVLHRAFIRQGTESNLDGHYLQQFYTGLGADAQADAIEKAGG